MTDRKVDDLERVAETIDIGSILRGIMDSASLGTLLGTLAGWLPELAAFFTIIWTLIRIYETDTVRSFLHTEPRKPPAE